MRVPVRGLPVFSLALRDKRPIERFAQPLGSTASPERRCLRFTYKTLPCPNVNTYDKGRYHTYMTFINLDATTRKHMQAEVEMDISMDKLYKSPRLSPEGVVHYPNLLRTAVSSGSDATFAHSLRQSGILNATEERKKPTGGVSIAKIPVTAPDTLAEGEFNRFYARGLCARAIAEKVDTVTVYRAKEVQNPRSESEALIGQTFSAEKLLQDLRQHIGTDTALGLPSGPNSGLSVRLT